MKQTCEHAAPSQFWKSASSDVSFSVSPFSRSPSACTCSHALQRTTHAMLPARRQLAHTAGPAFAFLSLAFACGRAASTKSSFAVFIALSHFATSSTNQPLSHVRNHSKPLQAHSPLQTSKPFSHPCFQPGHSRAPNSSTGWAFLSTSLCPFGRRRAGRGLRGSGFQGAIHQHIFLLNVLT